MSPASQASSASAISGAESSGRKCRPGTVTSVCAGQVPAQRAPGRDAVDRDLPRPGQRRAAALPGLAVGRAVDVALLLGERAPRPRGQDPLDEDVLGEHESFPVRPAQRTEERGVGLVRVAGRDRCDERLEVGDPADGAGVTAGPVDRQHPAPVVADEGDPLADPEGVEQAVGKAAVLDEPVAPRPGAGQLVRRAHADQVRGEAPTPAPAEDVAPETGRRRVAVQEHDRVAGARLPVGHGEPVHGRVPRRHRVSMRRRSGQRCRRQGPVMANM